ncbi:MAG: autoinducer binding domain-containing protein [Roseivivax sp.]|nr:autoinducer binding domain-containing protein [Roseivivax sp.]
MDHLVHRPLRAAERFIPAELLEVLLRLERCTSTDEVWNVVLTLARSLGLEVVDYVYATDFRNWEQAQFIRTTFDSKWLDFVRQFPHIRHTSNFRMHAVHYLTPLMVGPAYLDEQGEISPEKRRHIQLSAQMGLEAGVAFPLRMGDPGQAAVMCFGGRLSRRQFDALMDAHGWTLHAAALSAHTRYSELFKAEFIQRNQLTAKQKELIRMVGQGLLDKQIAHGLGISFSAVRQRLTAVQQKTGARNRADLAALAARLGLVSDPLIRDHAEDLTVFLTMGDGKTGTEVRPPQGTSTAAE